MISKTAILIDDDQDDLDILEESIRECSQEIACFQFKDATKALTSILNSGNSVPNFIFIDYNMPLLNGYQCLEEFRKDDRFDETIIVLLSTSMPLEIAIRLTSVGATYAFEKPPSFTNYVSLIGKVIPTMSQLRY